jgi:hypothetical protein
MAFPPFLMKQLDSCDFWMRETGTGQQVARLHDRYMMMMMMMLLDDNLHYVVCVASYLWRNDLYI